MQLELPSYLDMPDAVRARIAEYAAAGAQRLYLQVLDLHDLEHLHVLAETLL